MHTQMTSNGQRRRTFDFDRQEDSLLPIKRKATCSIDPVVVATTQAQKLELELDPVACSDLHHHHHNVAAISQDLQPSRSASPPDNFSDHSQSPSRTCAAVSGLNAVQCCDAMDIDPGPSDRASRQSVVTDGSRESLPHVCSAPWANLPSANHQASTLIKVPSGSHYPTIHLSAGDSFSHLEVCEFTRALKRSRLHETDSKYTRRGAVSNPQPSTSNTRPTHSTSELKEVYLQEVARPPLVVSPKTNHQTRQRRFQPALSSVRRRSWTTKLKPRANSLPIELPSTSNHLQRSTSSNDSVMTPSTPPTPTHTLPPLGAEATTPATATNPNRSGKNKDVQDTALEMLPTDSGVGSSSQPSSAPTSDDDEARPVLTGRAHGHLRRHHHHQIHRHRHHRHADTQQAATPLQPYPEHMQAHDTPIGKTFPTSMNLHVASISSPYPASSSSASPSSAHPGPSHSYPIPPPPIVPPIYPLITRDTLKELELDVTLRSPQLRHDILFDPGLQFRPTTGRRKREASDRFWEAIAREMQWGCTCTCFDRDQKIHPCICGKVPAGATPASMSSDVPVHPSWRGYVLGTSSRIRPLLETLKEVLHLVVHPASMTAVASNVAGSGTMPPTSPATDSQSSRSASVNPTDPLLAPFDPALIQQELDHGVFDHQSVFKWVGHMMKMHCAPMRDGMVENMVRLATDVDPTDPNPERRPVKALKMCFDILEVMKLDIANHQLQSLRPYLLDTSADFEMKTFQERFEKHVTGLDITRRWISRSYASSLQPSPSAGRVDRSKTVSVALCTAMVDLVFQPPAPPAEPEVQSDTIDRSTRSKARSCDAGFPETLYLDHARLTSYINDASDLLGLYMLIMLFRQLTTSGAAGSGLEEWEIDRIKREVWEVGPSRLGLCFDVGPPQMSSSGSDPKVKWEKGMSDVVLQIARRVEEAKERMAAGSSGGPPADALSGTDRVPSPKMLELIENWKVANYKKDSPLQKILQKRLQAAVLDVVKEQVLSTAAVNTIVDSSAGTKSPSARAYSAMPMRRINRHPLTSSPPSITSGAATATVLKKHAGSGLEPLMPEILHLGERIARLVVFHSRVYKRLYEVDHFIDTNL